VVGAVAGVALIGAFAFLMIRRRRNARAAADRESFRPDNDDMDYESQFNSAYNVRESMSSYQPMNANAPLPPAHNDDKQLRY
jgi:hypothetical protein